MKNNKHKNTRPSLYGFHAVREAWLNEERQVHALYLTEQSKQGFEAVFKEGKKLGLRRQPPVMIEKKKLEKMLPQGAVHQGVALSASEPAECDVQDLVIKAATRKRSVVLMLDQVTDPHNVGAILRSACAFGATGLVMQKKHAPALDGVLAKTACGAVEHVPVAFVTNLSRALEEMQEGGFFAYGLDERGEQDIGELAASTPKKKAPKGEKPLDIATQDSGPSEKIVLVLGAEGPGIRYNVKEHCDGLVRLPMSGPMPSINVSNAAAVALYALSTSEH